MIQNKAQLREYLNADRKAIGSLGRRFLFICTNEKQLIWRFQKQLRVAEYWKNTATNPFRRAVAYFQLFLLFRMQVKLGLHIPPNVFGPGLSISHLGNIIINGSSKVGANCRLHPSVLIGMDGREGKAPQIGNDVYLSNGAKILGDVVLSNDIVIGAQAVVTRSILDGPGTYAGVPARKISDKGNSFPMDRRTH